jgi:hypothetical protein
MVKATFSMEQGQIIAVLCVVLPRVLLGSVVRFPHPQRQELERLATQASFQRLACFNARCLGAGEQSDFYFDPHTKQYTGQGMCSKDGVRLFGERTRPGVIEASGAPLEPPSGPL